MTQILDGNKIAEEIKLDLKKEIQKFKLKPKLDVILVGDNEASKIYVKKKCEACAETGITSQTHFLKDDEWSKFRYTIKELNYNEEVNGILVQLPLPLTWSDDTVFDLINPIKDVDVFNPINVGKLVQNRPVFLPPTPHAIQQIFKKSGLPLIGKHVVVINRSNIVDKPLSSMLIQDNVYANATVTVCHNNTPPEILKHICLSADAIVVAVGIPGFLTLDMVKPHQIIIDVGITRIGKKIVGDVHADVKDKVAYLTPVPGGIGPLTVCMLLYNTIQACKMQNNL